MEIISQHIPSCPTERAVRTLAVVTRQPRPDLLDAFLDNDDYDVVIVVPLAHAYSHIRRVSPHLVVVCLEIEEMAGFEVLSMLKMDGVTERIPVLTYLMPSDTNHDGGPLETTHCLLQNRLLLQ